MFEVGFRTTGKDDLVKAIGPQISQIAQEINRAFSAPAGQGLKSEIIAATREANILQNALKKATSDKGISFVSLNSELRKAGTSAEKLVTTLAQGGPAFANSFNVALTALATANRRVITISDKIAEMRRVMVQSVKFTAAQTIQRQVMSAMASSIGWVKDLDRALTDISVVTGKVGGELDKVYEGAVRGSKELRVAADEYAKGALIFYQQGLSDEEVTRRTELTIKSAKAAGQSIADMSSQLTSIWNNYRMVGEEQEKAASVGAALAAQTAVDFKDIAEAMQTAAAPAAQMGVEYNQLAAIIATVGDVSQQSASTIGNAYKTIFSRFQQLRSEGTDGQVTLSSVSSQLKGLGIEVLDQAGNLRNLGDVINEVGNNWDNWTQTQQTAIAQIVGGTRQYGQFLTLMQNFDKYQKNLAVANAEDGSALEGQYSRALDSIQSRAENAAEAWKRAFGGVFDDELMKQFYGIVEDVGNAVDGVFEAFDDWKGILSIIIAMVAKQLMPSLINGAKNVGTVLTNLTPRQRQRNRERDANNTREAGFRAIANRRDIGEDTKRNITERLDGLNGKDQKERKTQLQALQAELAASRKLSNETQRQINLIMQKAQVQERLSTIAGEIEKLEKIGTQEATQKAEMLRAQLETYSQLMLSLADQTTELQRQMDIFGGEVTGQERDRASLIPDSTIVNEEVDNIVADLEKAKEAYAALESQADSIGLGDQVYYNDLENAKKVVSDLEKELRKKLDEIKLEITQAQPEIGREVFKIGQIVSQEMMQSLEEDNPGEAMAKKIIEGFKDDNSGIATALKESLQEALDSGEQIDFIDISSQIEDALGSSGEEISDDLRARIDSILQVLNTGSQGNAQGQNLFGSIQDQVNNFNAGLGTTVQAASEAALGLTLCANGINAMGNAIENMDFPAFIAGLTSLSGGVAQLVGSWPMMKEGAKALGGSLKTLGINIAQVVPGLGGVATAASGTGASFGAMAAAAGVAVVAIAAVVAVLAALAFAIQQDLNRKPENLFKRSAEAAQELASSAEKANQAAQELKDTFDTYKDVREQLDNCTRGTEEWEDALRKVNEAAVDVVNALPSDFDISSAYTRDNDGMIQINEGAIRAAQDNLDQKASQAQLAASLGQADMTKKQMVLDAGDIVKQITKATGDYSGTYELDQKISNNAQDFLNITIPELKKKLEELGVSTSEITGEELNQLQNSFQALAQKAVAASEKMELIGKLQVDEQLGDDYTGDEKDLAAQGMVKATEAAYSRYFKDLTNDLGRSNDGAYGNIKKGDTKINSQLLADYNKLTGNNYSSSANGVQGTDTERVFEFIDNATGEVIQKTAEVVAQEMAAGEALQNLGASAQLAREALNNLGQEAINYVNSGNMDTTSLKDLEDLLSGEDEAEDKENVADFFGGENQMKKIIAAQNGLADASAVTEEMIQEFVDNVIDSVYDSRNAIKQAGGQLSETTRGVYNDLMKNGNLDDITAAGAKNLTGALVKVYDGFGEEGVQKFGNILEGMGTNVDDFANVADKINWDTDGPELIRKKLKDLSGTSISISDEDLPELIKMMQKTSDMSLAAATSQYNTMREIYNSIDGNMSVISQDQINTLQSAGVNTDQYFQRLADGTYQLTEDADAFKAIVDALSMNPLFEANGQALQKIEDLKNFQNTYNGLGGDDATLYSADKLSLLQTGGYIGNEEAAKLNEQLNSEEFEVSYEAAQKIAEKFNEANISSQGIKQQLSEAEQEASEIHKAIVESQFRNDVEKAGFDVDETQRYAERLMEASEGQKMSEATARRLAIANQKLDRGLGNLNDNLKDYKKALKESNKGTAEWSKTMDALKKDLADILAFSDADLITDQFAEGVLDSEDLKKALDGDVESIQKLRVAAATDLGDNIVKQFMDEQTALAASTSDVGTYGERVRQQVAEAKKAVSEDWQTIQSILGTAIEAGGIEAGSVQQFENAMNDMITKTGMSYDEITSMLGSMGVDAEIITDGEMQTTKVTPTYTDTHYEQGPDYVVSGTKDGKPYTDVMPTYRRVDVVTKGEPIEAETWVPTYSIKMKSGEYKSGGEIKTGSPIIPPSPSSGSTTSGRKSGGGGGSKSPTPVKKVQKTEKKDKERYTDNENAVEDVTKAVDRLSKANDHAFGPQKIRNLNLMNIQLAKQAKAYQGLYNEAKMYTKLDAMSLVEGLNEFNQKYGTTLQAVFDGDDLLDNQMEIMNIITDLQNAKIDEINAVENEINALAAMNVANDDPRVTALTDKLEVLKESLSEIDTDVESMVRKNLDNYQEAIRKAEETMQAMVDILHQGLANEIEKYTLARDLHIKINDLEREHWEAIMDNMGEVGKLGKQTADMLSKSLGSLGNSVDRYVKHYGQMEDVQKRWENRDITLKAEYGITDEVWDRAQESGMIPQEIMDAFEGDIDALMSLRQEVWDNLDRQWQNYIDTIQHYIDEYDRITDKLDRQASISDNLLSLIDTVGFNYKWGADEDSASFKNMNTQMDIVRNKAKAVNGELEVATNRRIEAERELNNLLAGRTAKEFADNASEAEMFEYDRIKAHYDEMADLEADLNEQRISLLNEAYEKATEYAEKWGEVLAHESEKALNAMFSSYDQAMDMYNQKRDIDTFFMDEEDKVFELNKLQREINKTIEDASDPEMLNRYNELLKEIDEKKQAGVKMTEKDLEILQAQFDLEQARDAYEDARNAKNTMRLARDASGNWSYVYSADNSQTEDQAAAIEEKLHNIRKLNRDAADEYSETWLQLQVDWDNYIKSIDKARFEQEEEYRKEVEQRNNWYAEQSDLLSGEIIKHNDAIDRSFADTTVGVIINFGDMAQANETYKDNHNQLREKLRENYQSWIDKANETKDEVGGSMKDLEEVVNEETGKMMDEVEQLDIQIDTLNADAQSALGQLEGYISGWVDTVNREFQTTIDQIDALIDAYLEMLEVMAQQADANAGDPNYEYNAELNSAGLSYNRLREIKKNSSSYEEFLEKAQNDKDLQYWAWNGVQKGEQMSGQGHAGADYWKDKYGGDVDKALDSMIDHIWNEAADKIDHKSEETDKSQQAINSNNKYRAATGGLFERHAVTEIAENGPEIVLNKQDTENILKAVSMMREAVGRQMGAKSLALDSQVANASASASDYTPAAQEMQFDQNVKIEAVFPGVSAAGEIEQALNSIITQAAQYRIKK